MFASSVDRAFRRFQEHGDSGALAQVFDGTAPELQRFARYLASPESPAEDLLQATYLTAIESKQRFDASHGVLPWLLGILANHAREARRRQRRAIDPERVRRDVGLDPSEEAASTELSRLLDQAIARLPEAHRAVLRLYLQHGLEPAEIARSLERPPGTVRAQLSRGLHGLRRLLPPSVAASQTYAFVPAPRLAQMRAALLAPYGHPAPVTGTALPLGVLAMSLNKKLLAVAAVLIAAISFTTFRALYPRAEAPARSNEVAAKLAQPAEGPVSAPHVAEPEGRTEAPKAQEPVAETPAPAPTTGSLLVHVTDGDKKPLEGIGVALRTMPQLQNPGTLLDFVPSDANGNVLFENLSASGTDSRFVAEVDRADLRSIGNVVAGRQTEVSLRLRGVRVEGRVVDDQGTPVTGATIWAHAERIDSVPIATTNERGAFSLEHVSPHVALQARKPGHSPSKAAPVVGKLGASWQVELALEGAAGEVSGRVLDPHGEALAGALVAFVPDAAKHLTPYDRNGPQTRAVQTRTDADGRFRVREVPRGTVIVTAAGRNSAWAPAGARIEVADAPEILELRLGQGATLEGKLTENGTPMPDCTIVVFCSAPDIPASYLMNLLASRNATTDKQGEYRIEGILPGQVEMRALRNGMETIGQQTTSMTAGQACRWDLDGAAGKPMAFEIVIEPAVPPIPGSHWLVVTHGAEDSSTGLHAKVADKNGRVRIDRLSDGRYTAVLYCRADDTLPMLTRDFDAREQRMTLRVPEERLRLQPVRGRLLDGSGVGMKERVLRAHSFEEGLPVVLQRTTGTDGSFEFASLPAGRYVLNLLDGEKVLVVREFTVVGDRAEDLGDLTAP